MSARSSALAARVSSFSASDARAFGNLRRVDSYFTGLRATALISMRLSGEVFLQTSTIVDAGSGGLKYCARMFTRPQRRDRFEGLSSRALREMARQKIDPTATSNWKI